MFCTKYHQSLPTFLQQQKCPFCCVSCPGWTEASWRSNCPGLPRPWGRWVWSAFQPRPLSPDTSSRTAINCGLSTSTRTRCEIHSLLLLGLFQYYKCYIHNNDSYIMYFSCMQFWPKTHFTCVIFETKTKC